MRFSNLIGTGNFVAAKYAHVDVNYVMRLDELTPRIRSSVLRAIEFGYSTGTRGAVTTVYSLLAATQGMPPTFCSSSGNYVNAVVPTRLQGEELKGAKEHAKAMLAMADGSKTKDSYGYVSNYFGVEDADPYWLNWRSAWDSKRDRDYTFIRAYGRDVDLATCRAILSTLGVVELRSAYTTDGTFVSSTSTDAAGDYDIDTNLRSGQYKVGCDGPDREFDGSPGYVGVFFSNKATLGAANAVSVTAGQTTAGIDQQLVPCDQVGTSTTTTTVRATTTTTTTALATTSTTTTTVPVATSTTTTTVLATTSTSTSTTSTTVSPSTTTTTAPPPPTPATPPAPSSACSDGIDNDGDERADYREDKGCDSPDDPYERGRRATRRMLHKQGL